MRRFFAAAALAAGLLTAAGADAAALFFQFDAADSSITVTDNSPRCLPKAGCVLTASLLDPFTDLTIEEGAANAQTFDFAKFSVSPGFGGDGDARVEAVLAFFSPLVGSAGTGGTASYLRLGGFLHPGVVAGSLVWDDPVQSFTTADGSVFTVSFDDLAGVTFGSNAIAHVTISVDSIAAAAPEPAAWALIIAGFGLAGCALRSRRGQKLVEA